MNKKYTKLASNSINLFIAATAPFGTFGIFPEIASLMLPHINNIALYSSALAYGGVLGSLIFAIPLCMFVGMSCVNDPYLSRFNDLMFNLALFGLVAFSALIGSHLMGLALAGPMLTGLIGFGIVTLFNHAFVAFADFMLDMCATYHKNQPLQHFQQTV